MSIQITNDEGFEKLIKHSLSADIFETSKNVSEKIKKDTIIAYPADKSGCGNIRIINPMNYLNSTGIHNAIISNLQIHQNDHLLKFIKSVWFQRPYGISVAKDFAINSKVYKKMGIKMIIDHDDMLFGKNELQGGSKNTGVPSYNSAWESITETAEKSHADVLNLVDRVTVSTDFLGKKIKELGVETEIVTLQNVIPMYLWGKDKRPDITKKIIKPRVLYTGAPLHYNNKNKLKGDFDNAWFDWLIKNIQDDKIDFFVFGAELPWFVVPFAHKVHLLKFTKYLDYPNIVRSVKANLGIAPLIENDFNKCKSDIKFLEYAASGTPFIGSSFVDGNSPYENYNNVNQNVTPEQLQEKFESMMEVENYNKIKNDQYAYLVNNGKYLESQKYIETLKTSLFLND